MWGRAGVQYFVQLYDGMSLKSFDQLRGSFPPWLADALFLQLWRAIRAQDRGSNLRLDHSDFFMFIFTAKDKGIISHIYAYLLTHIQAPDLLPCREKWEADVGPKDGDRWDQILTTGPMVSVSAAQKLTHMFILHHSYRTPLKLHRWGRRESLLCPKCQLHQG